MRKLIVLLLVCQFICSAKSEKIPLKGNFSISYRGKTGHSSIKILPDGTVLKGTCEDFADPSYDLTRLFSSVSGDVTFTMSSLLGIQWFSLLHMIVTPPQYGSVTPSGSQSVIEYRTNILNRSITDWFLIKPYCTSQTIQLNISVAILPLANTNVTLEFKIAKNGEWIGRKQDFFNSPICTMKLTTPPQHLSNTPDYPPETFRDSLKIGSIFYRPAPEFIGFDEFTVQCLFTTLTFHINMIELPPPEEIGCN